MSAASDQKLFCKLCSPFNCSFDEFVGEKVVSPSYSSAILTPPILAILISSFLCVKSMKIFHFLFAFEHQVSGLSWWIDCEFYLHSGFAVLFHLDVAADFCHGLFHLVKWKNPVHKSLNYSCFVVCWNSYPWGLRRVNTSAICPPRTITSCSQSLHN